LYPFREPFERPGQDGLDAYALDGFLLPAMIPRVVLGDDVAERELWTRPPFHHDPLPVRETRPGAHASLRGDLDAVLENPRGGADGGTHGSNSVGGVLNRTVPLSYVLVVIRSGVLDGILDAASRHFPRELFCLLGGRREGKTVRVEEIVYIPFRSSEHYVLFNPYTIPLDPRIVGSAHSHPRPSPPSPADRRAFPTRAGST
ncbi:TPA: hypothetical protein EYP13_01470, partial [Candidatus Micrarchaeota archaeon]|nr:hypothetical protein [Candidatus Micrarchaeota archaeon]